jgi:protein-L-isoaspartate(D-aspartate) O-methyltransferase
MNQATDLAHSFKLMVYRVLLVSCLLLPCSCNGQSEQKSLADKSQGSQSDEVDSFASERAMMVRQQLTARDITNPRVLEAMKRVPRHRFVPDPLQSAAYRDSPLPIGEGQTISQPYIVALMTQLVDPKPDQKALDVGTGSGYQAAVLSELVKDVYSIEIVESLATDARARLKELGYGNITVRHGDGYAGWQEEAPFDVIIVAAAPDRVPPALITQLAPGGKLVIPIGDLAQTLVLIEKQADGSVIRKNVAPVAFVPMTGEAQK